MTLDESKEAFDILMGQWNAKILKSIDNEADTRFKLIDEILSSVLGWNRLGDFNLERYGESGYADYILAADGRDRMVVEAKRTGTVLVNSNSSSTQYLSAKSAALNNAQNGLKQAQDYCVDNGIIFAALTSGIEWIAYLAVREKGKKPQEGKVIVFPNLESISNNFAEFWSLFSRQEVIDEHFKISIHKVEGLQIQSSEKLAPILKPDNLRYLTKSQFSIDLDRIFKEFFSTMAGQNNPEMLAQCFVESKESREADINLEKITTTLLNRLEIMSSNKGEQLQRRIQNAVKSKHGEFVLIIGNKGAGKTTFIDRFFRLVLPQKLRESCIVARVDVGDSTGDVKSIVAWLDQKILSVLESSLFNNSNASNKQLQGIFYAEYCRWRDGPHKILYETDKAAFKIKFGEYLEKLRSNQSHVYIEHLLQDIIINRKRMPCLVFDNTDHFNETFQEAIFQYAQSLFRKVFSFIICPITDRTIWELSKHGPLQSYETTSFYLPVPAMKNVLEKRVNFIRRKLEENPLHLQSEYFLGLGIRLKVQDIKAFAACVEEIFVTNEGVSKIIGALANFDIRRSLNLSQKIVTSPHIKIEDLVRLFLTDGRMSVKYHSIYFAILCGDSNHFSHDSSHFILNHFEVRGDDITSPLLGLSILRFYLDIQNQANRNNIQSSHASVENALDYFNSMGVSQSTTKAHLQQLSNLRLLSVYDATETKINEDSRLRITPSGKIHYEWAISNEIFLSEMALTTPLRSCPDKDKLLVFWKSKGKKNREDWAMFVNMFANYCLDQDTRFISVPAVDSYKSQKSMRKEFRNKWRVVDKKNTTKIMPN